MKGKISFLFFSIVFIFFLSRCKKEDVSVDNPLQKIQVPAHFPPLPPSPDNPNTKYGVELGRSLFYDPILSSNGKISCASCHQQSKSFSDGLQFSIGVESQIGPINSISLINLAWSKHLFWNGRARTLEEQALQPIENKLEMNEQLENVINKLKNSEKYLMLFNKAFNNSGVSIENLGKAIAQFERTLISANSIYDNYYKEGENALLSAAQLRGSQIFFSETGDCFHCHGGVFGNNSPSKEFANNGLDENINGKGLGEVTKDSLDDGKFKVPSMRNISYSGPFMHDGKFKTLEEVVNFYSHELKDSRTLDPILKKFDRVQNGGINLTPTQKLDLIEFLKTFNDSSYLSNPIFSNPN